MKIYLLFLFFGIQHLLFEAPEPKNFVSISSYIPNITIEARYYSKNNFVGSIIDGYKSSNLILTKEAAKSLKKVQEKLAKKGLGLKVFDAYRPQMAVDHFMRWCSNEKDTINKHVFYPNVSKSALIPEGYIAEKSGHTRGSTVDLTIIYLESKDELDMGTPWDYFGPESWGDYEGVSKSQRSNRDLLRDIMEKFDFKPLKEEWWHFTLKNEPYPNTYFNFPVE